VLTQAFVWLNSASAVGSAGAAAAAGWAVGTFGAHGGFAVAAMAASVMAVLAVAGLRALRVPQQHAAATQSAEPVSQVPVTGRGRGSDDLPLAAEGADVVR